MTAADLTLIRGGIDSLYFMLDNVDNRDNNTRYESVQRQLWEVVGPR